MEAGKWQYGKLIVAGYELIDDLLLVGVRSPEKTAVWTDLTSDWINIL